MQFSGDTPQQFQNIDNTEEQFQNNDDLENQLQNIDDFNMNDWSPTEVEEQNP